MRLSGFHIELAKLIAQGVPNRDVMKIIKISDSRLSVLKANPVFVQEVEKWRKVNELKYVKAVKVFGDAAELVAKEMVREATNTMSSAPLVKFNLQKEILDRLAQSEGIVDEKVKDENEIVFEQLLRVTKRHSGIGGVDKVDSITGEQAMKELSEDLQDEGDELQDVIDINSHHNVIDISPVSTSSSTQVKLNPKVLELLRKGHQTNEPAVNHI